MGAQEQQLDEYQPRLELIPGGDDSRELDGPRFHSDQAPVEDVPADPEYLRLGQVVVEFSYDGMDHMGGLG